jgi:hypothetical protein
MNEHTSASKLSYIESQVTLHSLTQEFASYLQALDFKSRMEGAQVFPRGGRSKSIGSRLNDYVEGAAILDESSIYVCSA